MKRGHKPQPVNNVDSNTMRDEGEENTSDIQKTASPVVSLPDKPFRHTVVILLRETLEKEAETEHLIDWIQDMWDTVDTLVQLFGEKEAYKIMHARLAINSLVGGSQ